MQQFHPIGQQPVASHPTNPDEQRPCRVIKRPRITAFLRAGLKLTVGMSPSKPLTNNEGRSVNDTSNSTSENRRIVDGGVTLDRLNERFYRHRKLEWITLHVTSCTPNVFDSWWAHCHSFELNFWMACGGKPEVMESGWHLAVDGCEITWTFQVFEVHIKAPWLWASRLVASRGSSAQAKLQIIGT